ncbi:MAG: hypothetical protein ABGY29_06560 [bacterium]
MTAATADQLQKLLGDEGALNYDTLVVPGLGPAQSLRAEDGAIQRSAKAEDDLSLAELDVANSQAVEIFPSKESIEHQKNSERCLQPAPATRTASKS